MGGLMWLVFAALLAILLLSLLWLIWKLRSFSQSQSQGFMDDKLMQAMLEDTELSNKVKKALIKQAGGIREDEDDGEAQSKK